MKKVNLLILAALIFITLVLVKVIRKGVYLPERPMVKWSRVENPAEAGQKIARFLFPYFQSQPDYSLMSSSDFSRVFIENFENQLRQLSIEPQRIETSKLSFQFVDLTEDLVKSCQAGSRPHCIAIRVQKKLTKKSPQPGELWVRMDRISKTTVVLFHTVMD